MRLLKIQVNSDNTLIIEHNKSIIELNNISELIHHFNFKTVEKIINTINHIKKTENYNVIFSIRY